MSPKKRFANIFVRLLIGSVIAAMFMFAGVAILDAFGRFWFFLALVTMLIICERRGYFEMFGGKDDDLK